LIVAGYSLFPLKAPLIYPFRTTFGQHDQLDNILFFLRFTNGLEGWGEAAIAPHITGENVVRTGENLQRVGQDLIGKDCGDYLKLTRWLRNRLGTNRAAAAAVEMAVLDVIAQSRGLPLWRLFGRRLACLTTDITIVISDLKATQASVRKFYRQGFRKFKVKIGRDWEMDLQRVITVKKNAPRSEILLDANQGYTAAQAIKFLKALAKNKIHPMLIEQPVPKEDIEGLIQIRKIKLIPVCVDESAKTIADCRRVIKRKAADVINIKLMKTGFAESWDIARLAKAAGLKLMIGGMMESVLAMTAAAHFAAGLNCFDFIDLDPPFFIKGRWGKSPYLNSRGVYDIRGIEAGIGIKPKI
jgi:L-Ala-D/L-Glu epimerase